MTCDLCNKTALFRWTDTHGVAICGRCGLPYLLYHYDEENKRLDKPPALLIRDDWMPLTRRFWEETRSKVFPGLHDMGILRGRKATYSGATEDEMVIWSDWMDAHKAEHPKREEEP